MKVANIFSSNDLDLYKEINQEWFLTPAHLLDKYPDYKQFFEDLSREDNKYIILDNSAFELRKTGGYSVEAMLDLAKNIKIAEIMAPEKFGYGEATIKLIKEFIPKVPKHIPIHAVVCGENIRDWTECYSWMVYEKRIDVIGLSYMLGPEKYFDTEYTRIPEFQQVQTRMKMLEWIYCFHLGRKLEPKPIHLLGCSSPYETVFAKQFPFVRSIDSSIAYIMGYHNYNLFQLQRPCNMDFEWETTEEQKSQIIINALEFQMLAKHNEFDQ